MYLLRCAKPLLRQMLEHLPVAAPRARSTTRLGDWYAKRINSAQRRYVIAVNADTLISVVVPARSPTHLAARIADAFDALLLALDAAESERHHELALMRTVSAAPMLDRSIIARVNDTALRAAEELYDLPHRPGRVLAHVDLLLANIPRRSLGDRTPADAVLERLRS